MENKEIILQNAIKLFAQKGYDAIGIQEICTESNITKPTLYYYFKSKQGLLEEIRNSKGAEIANLIQQSLVYKHDFMASLTLALKTTVDFALANPDFFRLHLNLLSSAQNSEAFSVYSSIKDQIFSAYLEFFSNSTNEFGNMKGKEKLYSVIFCENVNQIALQALNGFLTLDSQNLHLIIHSFIYGVAS